MAIPVDIDLGKYALGWSDAEDEYVFKPKKGLNEEIISDSRVGPIGRVSPSE